MPNWINNRLYVKNTGPEFDLLKALFREGGLPFSKFCPMPVELVCGVDDIEILIEKSRKIRQRREYWNPKANKVIGKLNSLGFNIPLLKDLNYLDFAEMFLQEPVKRKTSLQQTITNWRTHRRENRNFKKFGAKNWDEWCLNNWGTKLDASDIQVIYSGEDEFCVEFYTAWHPPSGIYKKLGLDFPNCILMTFAWSIESDFMSCAIHTTEQSWIVEELGSILNDKNEFLNPLPKPSHQFLEAAKQFNTFLPISFNAPEAILGVNPDPQAAT
jgi:hypothetical protein